SATTAAVCKGQGGGGDPRGPRCETLDSLFWFELRSSSLEARQGAARAFLVCVDSRNAGCTAHSHFLTSLLSIRFQRVNSHGANSNETRHVDIASDKIMS